MVGLRLDELMEQIQGRKASSNNNNQPFRTEVNYGLEVNNISRSMEIGVPKFDGKDSNGSISQDEDYQGKLLLFSRPTMAALPVARAYEAHSDGGPAVASNGPKWSTLTAQVQNQRYNPPIVSPNTTLLVQYHKTEHTLTPHTQHYQNPSSTEPPLASTSILKLPLNVLRVRREKGDNDEQQLSNLEPNKSNLEQAIETDISNLNKRIELLGEDMEQFKVALQGCFVKKIHCCWNN